MPPKTPLLRPRAYFERARDPFFGGLVVFVLYVIGTIIGIGAMASLVVGQIDDPPAGLRSAMTELLLLTAIIYVVIAVVALLIVAAIMHLFTAGPDSEGSFGDAVGVAGWAYAPEIASLPLLYLYARWRVGQLSIDGSDPELAVQQMETLQDPSGVGLLVTFGVVAWSVYILAKGTSGTHDVDIGNALLPALLIGVGSFLLSLL